MAEERGDGKKRSYLLSDLEHIGQNLYIHPADEMYAEKLLRFRRNDFHLLMRVAGAREKEGRCDEAIALYRRAEKKAPVQTYANLAALRRLRLEREAQPLPLGSIDRATGQKPLWVTLIPGAFLLGFLLGLFLFFWLLLGTQPVEPQVSSGAGSVEPLPAFSAEPVNTATSVTHREVAFQEEDLASRVVRMQLLFLRSALWGYVQIKGRFPERLEDLVAPHPDNFISAIPSDPYFHANRVVSAYDGNGGWWYQKPEVASWNSAGKGSDRELAASIVDALKPNLSTAVFGESGSGFQPLQLRIKRQDRTVSLLSQDGIWWESAVAVGREEASTPDGSFQVMERVWQPRRSHAEATTMTQSAAAGPWEERNVGSHSPWTSEGSPYGIAALALSLPGYALHGTHQEASVGQAVTEGCLRLTNADMRRLYPAIPAGIPVVIEPGEMTDTDRGVVQTTVPGMGKEKTWSRSRAWDAFLHSLRPDFSDETSEEGYLWRG